MVGAIRLNRSDSDKNDLESKDHRNALRLELSQDETQILLKACKRYRSTIPSYLQARKAEIKIVDSLISILSGV